MARASPKNIQFLAPSRLKSVALKVIHGWDS